MASKVPLKTTFEVDKIIQPIFTGGSVSLDRSARILATTLDEDAVLTNLTTGQRLAAIEGDGEKITSLILTPSASYLILCSRSLSMRIYVLKRSCNNDSIEPRLLRTLKPHGTPVVAVAVDRTGTLLATGAADGNVKVWDIAGGYVTHVFRGPSVLVSILVFFEVSSVKNTDFQPQKNARKSQVESTTLHATNFRVACGSQDGKIRIWDLHKRRTVATDDKGNHASHVRGLDYSAEKHALVTGGRDKTITWWYWHNRIWRPRRTIQCSEQVEALGFLGDGSWTYSAGPKGWPRIWETESGRELTKPRPAKSESQGIVTALLVSEESMIVSVLADHTFALYRIPESGNFQAAQDLQPFRRISGTHDDILDLVYLLPDHSLMALATNSDDVRLISVAEAQDRGTVFGEDVASLQGHEDLVVSLDVDWSGHWVATGSKDNSARIWRVDGAKSSFASHAVFNGHAQAIGAVALPKAAPAMSTESFRDPVNHPPAFLMTGSKDMTIKKWEVPRQAQQSTGRAPRALFTRKAHDKDINSIDVDPLAHTFASGSQDKTVKIWDVETGEVRGILKGHRRGVWTVRFAPSLLAPVPTERGSVAGKSLILTGSTDKTIKLWNLLDYSCLKTFEGHANSVLKVAWLRVADEKAAKGCAHFTSAGADGLVKVWDTSLGETVCTLDNHDGRIWALAVDAKTNTVASGSEDSTITFWKDTTCETQAAASAAALRLVEQEQQLQNYMHAGAYRDAILLALQLDHPGRLLGLFTNVVTTPEPDAGSLCGLSEVDQVLGNLSDEQIFMLLLRLRDWNTNARTAPVAQRILWTLVRSYPASRFSSLSVRGARGQKSLNEVLDALRVYTERHYKRVKELVDESYLVEYTLQEMDSLAPSTDLSASGTLDVVMAEAG